MEEMTKSTKSIDTGGESVRFQGGNEGLGRRRRRSAEESGRAEKVGKTGPRRGIGN